MAIRFLNALNIDGTVTATINQDANDGYDGILVSTSGLIERRTKAQILADIGAGSMSSFTVTADTNTNATTITNGDDLKILGGTGVSTTSDPDGTITIDATGSSYTKWVLAGDSGTDQDINDGNTATFKGVNGIVTETKATDTIEIGFPIASLTAATVAGSDLVAIADVNDSDGIRKVTAQSIADLAPQGDITAVQASTTSSQEGIKVNDSTGPIPKVGLDIIGQSNIGAGNLADDDEFIVHDDTASRNLAVTFKTLKDQIASAVGDITGIDAGAGIVVNDPTTTTPEVAVKYAGANDNLVQSATSLEGSAIATDDVIIYSDHSDSDKVVRGLVSDLPFTSNVGDVTAVEASTANNRLGIAVSSSSGPVPKVGINIVGLGNIAVGQDPADADEMIIYDATATTNVAITLKDLSDYIGAVTSVSAGAGLTSTGTATAPTIKVDYSSTGIINDANDGTSVTLVDTDEFLFEDASGTAGTAVMRGTLSQLKSYIGAGSYTWTLSDGSTTQTINDGDTVTVSGKAQDDPDAGIVPVVSATDTLTLSFDPSKIELVTALDDPDSDQMVYYDSNNDKNQRIAISDVHLNEFGAPTSSLNIGSQKLTNVANGTQSTDGVNLGQVETLVAGQSLFKGAYDATNEPGSPAISGASNIANSVGDFYAVTVGGAFFSFTLEPGDLIFINNDITANSNPGVGNFTVVQSGQSIATAASTDGASTKGIAGFDSAVFTVTGNGWVQLIDQSITEQSYGGASKSLTITFDKYGVAQSAAEQTIDISASQVSDFCSAVSTCIASNEQYTANLGNGSATSIAVTHSLGTKDVMVQLYDNTNFDTVYADVVRNTVDQVTVSFTSAPASNGIRILITKVS